MRALTWQGNQDVRVTDVPDPRIQEPTDAIIAVTSTAICGSDLHLYGVLGPYLSPGDVLGHEAMGVVEEVGADVTNLTPGDRVVIPFNISCGHCWMCNRGLYAQCETTQVRGAGQGRGAVRLHVAVRLGAGRAGGVPAGPAGAVRPGQGPATGPDEQFLFLSDVLPTAWQAVAYADTPKDGTLAVLGLGPIGQIAARIARHLGVGRVIGVDPVPERLAAGGPVTGSRPWTWTRSTTSPSADRDDRRPRPGRCHRRGRAWRRTGTGGGRQQAGRGRAEGHRPAAGRDGRRRSPTCGGGPARRAARRGQGGAPRRHGLDQRRLRRRGRSDADDGDVRPRHAAADGPGARQALDRRHHAAGRRRAPTRSAWTDLATHHLPLEEAPHGYEIFRDKDDGCIKVVAASPASRLSPREARGRLGSG